jgi:pimeloyl-ACP methyl ester carboxylesterase
MPTDKINGVNIFWELTGDKGEPLVLVHGSWGDHHNWDMVAGELARTFRVLTYDRRGHSQSESPPGQGYAAEDVSDLIELVEQINLSPAHIAGNSYGAAIVLKAAAKRPDIFRSLIIHEPPLFGILKDNPNAQQALKTLNGRIKAVLDLFAGGKLEKATETFMETIAMGPGSWQQLPETARKTFIHNAPTWFDEMMDPQSLQIDLKLLSQFKNPALLTAGSESPPFFPLVIDRLANAIPHAKRITIEGAGHVPHMSHAEKYIDMVRSFCFSVSNKSEK